MALTYPIPPDARFCVYDSNAGAQLNDGKGRPMQNIRWGGDPSAPIPGLDASIHWLLEVKESAPAYDPFTQKLEKVTNFDTVAATATESYNVVALTAEEQEAKLGDYFTTSGGVKLATGEHDQNSFANLLTLLNQAGTADSEIITVKDVKGELYGIDFGTLKADLVGYGNFCYQKFLA